jgi:hypothetical protein
VETTHGGVRHLKHCAYTVERTMLLYMQVSTTHTCTTVSNTARGRLLSASARASAASNLPAESIQLMRSSVSRWRPITMSCTQHKASVYPDCE